MGDRKGWPKTTWFHLGRYFALRGPELPRLEQRTMLARRKYADMAGCFHKLKIDRSKITTLFTRTIE
jgi:hypothetical protein